MYGGQSVLDNSPVCDQKAMDEVNRSIFVAMNQSDMNKEEARKTRADCVRVIKECLIFYTTFAFALLAIFRYVCCV